MKIGGHDISKDADKSFLPPLMVFWIVLIMGIVIGMLGARAC